MAGYWLCVTTNESWNVVKKQRIWGVSERNRRKIERVKPGDFLVFYVKPKKIAGIFKATTKSFEDNERIFGAAGSDQNDVFPYRIRLETVKLAESPIPIEGLVGKLKFITSKTMWRGYFRRAMQIISEEDFSEIKSSIERT